MFPDDYYKYPEQYFNVFYLDEDPIVAARLHCDKHVEKMILITSQVLSTVWCSQDVSEEIVSLDWGVPIGDAPPRGLKHLNSLLLGQRIYPPSHAAHPCVKWAGLYGGNYDWLYRLGMALLEEARYRFGRIHACTPVLRVLEVLPPALMDSEATWCDAPAVVPVPDDREVVEQYREFYQKQVLGEMRYTKRAPPDWLDGATFLTGA